MKNLSLLLSPKMLGLKNRLIRSSDKHRKRAVIMSILGLSFWAGMFILATRVLIYFQSVDIIGDLLAHHLLSMLLLTFFSLLIFSNIITALSNLYISYDLQLCHSMPTSLEEIFISRSILTMLDSSWMVVIFGLPVMMAYAYVYRPGPEFYLSFVHMGLALIIIAGGVGILITMILVNIFPAHRTRDIIMLLVIVLIMALYLMFRLLRPERLVDPDAFFSIMQYLGALEAPDSPYIPTHWVTENLWDYLKGSSGEDRIFNLVLLWSTAGSMVAINIWVAEVIYFKGYSKSQEAKRRIIGAKRPMDLFKRLFSKVIDNDLATVMDKEIRTFFRDNSQWSQLLLLAALIVVYLYNFTVLPLDKSPIRLEFLQNEIAFLNMGLAGFVLSAVAVRFIFPTISAEGEAFWLILSSPLSLKRFLWGKYLFYLPLMIFMAEVLVIATNVLLEVPMFMMILLAVTMFLAVFGIVAMGIGFGALYPNFRHENIAQVATGFGGVVYMITTAVFLAAIIVLEAGPVYMIYMAKYKGLPITTSQWLFIVPSFMAVLILNGFAVYKPMKMGLESLRQYE
jgi:ABC-2 type transport system permease protein